MVYVRMFILQYLIVFIKEKFILTHLDTDIGNFPIGK